MTAGDERPALTEAQQLHEQAAALRRSGNVEGSRRAFAELAQRFGEADNVEDAFQAAIAELELADMDAEARDDAGAGGHAGTAWSIGVRLTARGVSSGAFLALHSGPRLARARLAERDGDGALSVLQQTLQALGAVTGQIADALIPCARHVAFVLIDNEAYSVAGPLLDEVVQVTSGMAPPAESNARAAVGDALARAGNEPAALGAYRDALAVRPEGTAGDELARANLVTTAGVTADHLGQYALAARMYEWALEIRERLLPPDDVERIRARYNVAELARFTGGDLDRVAGELDAVAQALRAQADAAPDLLSLALKNLAQTRIAQGRPADAEVLIREALALGVGGADRRAQLLVSLGQVQRDQGSEPDVAQELEAIAQELLAAEGPESRRYLWLLGSIAPLLPDDRAEGARRSYEQILGSIGEPQSGQEREMVIGALVNLALILWSQADHAGALDAFRRASLQQEQVRAETWRVRSALETEGGDRIPFAPALVELVLRHLADRDDARGLAFRVGTGSKRLQAEVLRRQRELVLEGDEQLLDLHRLASRLRVAEAAGAYAPVAEGHQDDLDDLDDLDSMLALQLPARALLDAFESSEAASVAASLPRHSILVEYLRCPGFKRYRGGQYDVERAASWYVAFVLPARAAGDLTLVDLGDADRIDEAVLALRAALADSVTTDSQGWGARARAVAELIWDPVAPLLDVDARVIVASDGQIAAVPFDALVTANGLPLLTQCTITSIGTGRDARLLDSRPNWTSEDSVVIGAPEFGEPWAPFVPLPGTQGEANRVGKLLGVEPTLGEAATRDLLLDVRDPEVLHLATHGYYLPATEPVGPLGADLTDLALRSPLTATGVALADANRRVAGATRGFEGVASALDVLGLELYGTDLTVVSACESAFGPLDEGEGLVTLARSFLLAGSRSVLSTLWLVDDWATSDVMEGFYKRLLRATPRGVALYRAKRDTYARHPDRPDLWAAFVLAGDPDELARYRLLAPPSSQFVERPAVKEGGVTYLDTSRRLFTSFEVPDVPVEGRPLRVASISVRNLARGIAEDKRDEAMRSFDEGRYEDAANGLLEALEGLDESSAAAQQLIAKLHRDAAIAFGYLGDLQRSLEHGLAALALYAALEDWPLEMGQVLDNIAAVEVGLGRTEDARDHYEQALAIKREERPGGHPSIDFTVERLMELGGSPPPAGMHLHLVQPDDLSRIG